MDSDLCQVIDNILERSAILQRQYKLASIMYKISETDGVLTRDFTGVNKTFSAFYASLQVKPQEIPAFLTSLALSSISVDHMVT